jgi:DtxR family Mn-dependent transcriptional regulator
MTPSQEDYLEMVSFLSDEGEVRITDIASRLGFSKPSVSAAIKLLEERNLIQHQRYSTVTLTKDGQALAQTIRERHTLIKQFLQNVLSVSPDAAEKDACKMEHILSEETLQKIKQHLHA